MPKVHTSKISLVPTDPKHVELWHSWRSEPTTLKYNPIVLTTIEKLKERMALMSSDLSNLKAADEFQFFIQHETKLVGTLSLKNISHMMMYGEIGYDVGQEFQGQGIATEAVRQFVAKIFSETSIRRLVAYVAEDNLPSRKLLDKVGFQQEGLCREHFIINGKPTNEVLYGILKSDWSKSTVGSAPKPADLDTLKQPLLETQRLILEPFKDSDLPDILAYASHPEVSQFVLWEAHKTIEDSQKFLDFIRKSTCTRRSKLFFVFAIRSKASDRVIGSIDFKNLNEFIGQIDYALGYENWGKGIMSEAAQAISNWVFVNLPELVRLQAFCVAENIGSSRVMEKIGMSHEGTRRKVLVLKGKLVDLADYAIIKDK